MSTIYEQSIEYHERPTPGKLTITPTKPLVDQRDLALAYSPGVAEPCRQIAEDAGRAFDLTAKGNLIAVISNGTAVLGLGDMGALASKPVMEGKAVLFKKFAGIDVFDLEINEKDPDKLVEIIKSLEPTFGGINLEDIRAPECFYIEQKLIKSINIPVFHDDQHGTAIIVAAAVINGLKLVNKKIEDVSIVTSGAGAAAISCLDLLVALGIKQENIIVCDRDGVVYKGRDVKMDPAKAKYAANTKCRHLKDCLIEADIFLGLSAGGVVTQDMIRKMAEKPLVFALANPEPEIYPNLVHEVRPDAITATGRTDFANQVNNVLCFPYIFRGALDVGATTINQEMKIACVKALSKLAQQESSDVVSEAYGGEVLSFGPKYIIPKPFDPRLIIELPIAVAKAAMDTGVAKRPLKDLDGYRQKLTQFVYRSSGIMRNIFAQAKEKPMRIVFSEGEEERILQATQTLVDEGLAKPILIGRPNVVERRIKMLGLRLTPGVDFDLTNPQDDVRFPIYWRTYHHIMERRGVSPDLAKTLVRTNNSIIAALSVQLGDGDCCICGPVGSYKEHLGRLKEIFGMAPGINLTASLGVLILERGPIFIADTYVNGYLSATEIADVTFLAAQHVRRFGIEPKVALVSHSSFGTESSESAQKMREALDLICQRNPDFQIEGEMHVDAALCPEIRNKIFPSSTLEGAANVLIMPCVDSANIAYNLAKVLGKAQTVGPILLGLDKPAFIATPSTTVRGIVNMAALAISDAQNHLREAKVE